MDMKIPSIPVQPHPYEEPQEYIATEDPSTSQVDVAPLSAQPRFPIIGISVSAGGFKPLDQYLKNILPCNGMAYAIVQHQDPTHKGLPVELLQRAALMPVILVRAHLKVEADCVYVIPPVKDMFIMKRGHDVAGENLGHPE